MSYVPFFSFNGSPPQDSDALLTWDRDITEKHPGLKRFYRPICAADMPDGKMTYKDQPVTKRQLEQLRTDFYESSKGMNATLVTVIAQGIRARTFVRLEKIDLTCDGSVYEP